MTHDPILQRLGSMGVVPVLVIDASSRAAPLGEALVAGGLPCAEVTLRTDAALDSIRMLARDPDMLVGAGTVVRPAQVGAAVDAGARFVVSPGLSAAVVAECRRLSVTVIPGVATATEIQHALDLGVDVVKFFPAESAGGVRTVRALAAPFPGLQFVPTGGITLAALPSYLALPAVLAVGGSWLVPDSALTSEDLHRVTRATGEVVTSVQRVRGGELA